MMIPKPGKMEPMDGAFALTPSTGILVDKDCKEAARIGSYLQRCLRRATGFTYTIQPSSEHTLAEGYILLTTAGVNESLGDEGYELVIEPKGVLIRAPKPAGLFYGVQTLRQLLPPSIERSQPVTNGVSWEIPCVRIEDKPRFVWRGFLLDSVRHFQSKAFIKDFIDLLSCYKINRLHWHLTDNEAWRFQTTKYPQLVQPAPGDDRQDTGFYTHDDIRDIIACGRDRYVTVYPEFDMPGHARALVYRHPELACVANPAKRNVKEVCLANPQTIAVMQDILTEAMDLFGDSYIHIGGDEARDRHWKRCPKCQARMREEDLKSERLLQKWFMSKVADFVRARGRESVVWADRLALGIPEGQIVQGWHCGDSRYAITHGFRTINSLHLRVYLDYPMAEGVLEPKPDWMPYLPLEKVYSFDPIPSGVTREQAGLVLGSEACLWTEEIPQDKVHVRTFPRLFAFSEALWSPKRLRNWVDFQERVKQHCKRLDVRGVDYYKDKLTGL